MGVFPNHASKSVIWVRYRLRDLAKTRYRLVIWDVIWTYVDEFPKSRGSVIWPKSHHRPHKSHSAAMSDDGAWVLRDIQALVCDIAHRWGARALVVEAFRLSRAHVRAAPPRTRGCRRRHRALTPTPSVLCRRRRGLRPPPRRWRRVIERRRCGELRAEQGSCKEG